MELVRDDERVRLDSSPGGGEHVDVAPELDNVTRFRPPSELASHIGRVPVTGKEETTAKHRQLTHRFQESTKFHCIILPLMASRCNV